MSTQVLALFLMIVLASSVLAIAYADPIRPSDNTAKRNQLNALSKLSQNHNCNVAELKARIANTTEFITFYNKTFWCGVPSTTTPVPLVEICGNGIDDDKDGLIDEGCTVNTSIPKVNTTTTLRIAIVGDVDDNSGLVTQVNLAKKHGAECFVVPGDFAYNSASGAKSKIEAGGFKCKIVSVGNHDTQSFVKSWMGVSTSYYEKYYKDAKLQFIVADSDTGFGCTTTQFNVQKQQLQDSDAWYKIFVLHHPFATVKSDHGPNGQFGCYDPIFQDNGLDIVAQAHNHNWQLGKFGTIWYGVFGTGTHDSGSSMYPCESSTFNNINMNCKTGTNGVTFVDFPILKQGAETLYFVSNADKLISKWGGN